MCISNWLDQSKTCPRCTCDVASISAVPFFDKIQQVLNIERSDVLVDLDSRRGGVSQAMQGFAAPASSVSRSVLKYTFEAALVEALTEQFAQHPMAMVKVKTTSLDLDCG